MKIKNRQPRGNASGGTIAVLLICVGLAAAYFLVLKQPKDVVEEESVEEVAVEPEPEPTPVVEKPVVVAPVVVEPVAGEDPVVEEKTEVDLYLEKKFPLPTFAPLDELVGGWGKVAQNLFPETVEVRVSRLYSALSGEGSKFIDEGHRSTPIKRLAGKLTVESLEPKGFTCRVKMDDTDFKEQISAEYEAKKSEKIQAVLAKREAYREKAIAYLANKNAVKPVVAKVEVEAETEFEAKKYGRKFRGEYWPNSKNGKNSEFDHEVPMGAICGVASVLYGKSEAVVVSLWDKGPGALAGLEAGDVMLKVNGKPFAEYSKSSYSGGAGFPEDLGMAMMEAQDSKTPLELTVKRGGEMIDLSIELPHIPQFAEKFPADCQRSEAVSQAALDYLAERTNDEGRLGANDYTNAWYGLALLSTGEPKNMRIAKKLARYYGERYNLGKNPSEKELISPPEGKGSSSNWFVATVGMFLAEYHLATGDKRVLEALDHCCRSMDVRINMDNGRYGHHGSERTQETIPYGGKGLVVINIHAHIMWALTAQIRGLDNWDWKIWDTSYESVNQAVGGAGEVGYNFSARGGSQSGSRTGAMLTALVLADQKKKQVRTFGKWLNEHNQCWPDVHAMTFIGPIYGFTGLKNSRPSFYRKAMDDYRWLFSITQPVNFSQGSYYYGDRGNSGGDSYCNKPFVGNIMSIYVLNSHRSDTLWMLGNRKKEWNK